MEQTVDAYIDMQAPELAPMLVQLRRLILSAVPEAEEKVAYGVPCYKYLGSLVGFGANKTGCSFYTMNPALPGQFSAALRDYHYSVSTIHFRLEQQLPEALLREMIACRVRENEALARAKAKKKKK